jgi:CheY-like chemotaxis protein
LLHRECITHQLGVETVRFYPNETVLLEEALRVSANGQTSVVAALDSLEGGREAFARKVRELNQGALASVVLLAPSHLLTEADLLGREAGFLVVEKPLRFRALVDALREHSEEEAVVETRDLRLLVVEDNKINQKVILRHLANLGHEADLAENGEEAVRATQERRYDLIFMDCQMPVMDGYQASLAIREHEGALGYRTPIVAVTANAMAGDREKCLDAGMDDHLPKPVKPANLREALARWVDAPASALQD